MSSNRSATKRLRRGGSRPIKHAAIGSTVGAVVGGYDNDPMASVVAGGVLGAAVAAITGRDKKKEKPDPEAEEYLRALSACLEARGYEVVVGATSVATTQDRG